jgi:alcohol dehydrogenase class IV
MQQIIETDGRYERLDAYFKNTKQKKLFLVCGNSVKNLAIGKYFDTLEERFGIQVIRFSDFQPNPLYESVVEGVHLLNAQACRLIAAVGGGSAMDVAKCIKLYADMDPGQNYLEQRIVPNDIELMAIPTTAGTGSEATRFAVIYAHGEKQSVTDASCIPSTVVIDPTVLETLPEYQKKATMLDALCHATESFWSVHSTEESQALAVEAIGMVLEHFAGYLSNTKEGNAGMLKAANLAGKAINITQTTAGHAMCYKLTTLYGIAHGHAAALCVSKLFPYMLEHLDAYSDPRGRVYVEASFGRLARAYGCDRPRAAAEKFDEILDRLDLEIPQADAEDYEVLKKSVNPVRLANNPVRLDVEAIDRLYHSILQQKKKENGEQVHES